jgi:HEPN domain-containing protein
MTLKESQYPKDWFRVEKYLKGYLLSKGWKLQKVHDLETLLNQAILYDPSFEEFRFPCIKMTEYYLEDRYPFVMESALTKEEMTESLDDAKKVINKIKKLALRKRK